MKYKGFVIYGAMRTGSNYLVSLLNQFPHVVCHGEVFNPGFVGLHEDYFEKFEITREEPGKRDPDINGFYEKLLHSAPSGTLCGFKLFPGHHSEILRQTLHDPEIAKIILKRDVLISYISLCQAEISGVWMIKDSDPASRAKSQERSDVKIKFDGPRFLQYRRRISEFYREIEETVQNLGQRALLFWYKDLHDPETVKKISEFLGCTPPEKIQKPKLLVKQNLSAPHERVINVQEMVEFLDLHNCKSTVVEDARNSLTQRNDNMLSINGIIINPENSAISPAMRKRIRSQKYEVQEARCVAALVEPGEVVLELGGGIGYISSLVAKTQKAKKIVVVEANPELTPIIKETHKLNNVDAEILNGVAMPSCEKQCSMPFYIRSDFWASSLSPEPWEYSREVSVPVIDLDDLITKYKPSLVICDIEGGERNLLLGIKFHPCVKKILLELHESAYGPEGVHEIILHLSLQRFAYSPSLSEKSVVVFKKV